MRDRIAHLRDVGTTPVDATSLAVVRIAFGVMLAWEGWRYIDHTRIERYFTGDERFWFTYWPFSWVQPLPQPWSSAVIWTMVAAGALVALGIAYRLSMTVLWLTLTWLFLLDKARYLNHLYLMVLIGALLLVLPANRALTLGGREPPGPEPALVPRWTVWLLRFQVALPYTFGGIAKLNTDWFDGRPLGSWIEDQTALC